MAESVSDILAEMLSKGEHMGDRELYVAFCAWSKRLRDAMAEPDDAAQLRQARTSLGWSLYQMADALEIGTSTEQGAKRVREMEERRRLIPGPVKVAVRAFLGGYKP